MAVESAADLASFFDTGEFGVTASWTPSGGSAQSIAGLLIRTDIDELDGSGAAQSSRRPVFQCRSADVTGIAYGDALTVSGTGYTVAGLDYSDDGAITKVILTES